MIKVLIVDDHEVVRRGLKQIMEDHFPKARFGEARNSQEAIELITKEDWAIILLDINIPGRSGLDVLEEIHRRKLKYPVVILSAFPEQDFALRALKLGAAGYLTKQSASDELIAAVKKAMAGGRYVTAALAERLAESLGKTVDQAPHEALSNRELQVLRLIASGKTMKEIGAELALSEKTIGTYRTRISEKLNLSTNVELTRYALQHRLIDFSPA